MGVVLAIDPGRRQGKAIERLTADLAGHEIVVAGSGDEAIGLLDLQVPDLFLFPLSLSPSDEARLRAQLDALTDPAELKALTLPLRAFLDGEAQASRPTATPPRWFYWFKPATPAGYDVDDSSRFAEAVRTALSPAPPAAPVPATTWTPASPIQQPASPFVPEPRAADVSTPAAPVLAAAPAEPLSAPADVVEPGSLAADVLDGAEPAPSRVAIARERATAALGRLAGLVAASGRTAWRVALGLPRPALMAAPVLVILLTLGVTGRAGAVLGAPGRWVAATKAHLFPEKPATGIAEIQSVPDGAEVWMNGRQIGVTPMRTEFAVGSHEVELRHKGTTRSLILDVLPGATVVQRIEWAAPRAAVGRLRIESDPAGAIVAIDGKPRGVTPLNADDLAVGKHTVDLTHQGNTVRESVDIKANKTTTLRTSVYQGWLALFSPIDVKIAINGRAISLDDQNRVLLPAGQHDLTLQNRKLGFTVTQSVAIKPGETTPVSVTLPKTPLTVTASGPAEVLLDGTRIGDVPIVDLPIDIGTHDVLLRSPEHGERRLAVTATVEPVRLAVDLAATTP